jgi:SAM-dependent methyltransferase
MWYACADMRANTNRDGRLGFDRVVDDYDAGRRDVPLRLVEEIVEKTGLTPRANVLEIGAATGQLTRPLLAAGLRVVALEPGDQLRERLVRRAGADSGLRAIGDFFEDFETAERFAAVCSANAFHWVDPAVSYRHAAELLDPAGHLVLLWAYPILAAPLQRELNERVLSDNFGHTAWNPDTFQDYLAEITAAGREELLGSGFFDPPTHWWTTDAATIDVDSYLAFLLSFGDNANRSAVERTRLGGLVRSVLADLRVDRLDVIHNLYTCVAQVRRASGPS